MIITCPSCRTRYRSPAGLTESSARCSCSRCEAVFPADRGLSEGLSVENGAAVGEVPVPVVTGPVLSIGVHLEPEPQLSEFPTVEDLPREVREPVLSDLDRSIGREPVREAVPEKEPEPEPAARAPRPGFIAYLVVMALPAAMAGAAWYYSPMFGEDPMKWTAPAGIAGLLLTWLWVRWKYRER